MTQSGGRFMAGVVLVSIGAALIVNVLSAGKGYWGPVVLLAVGLALIAKEVMAKPEEKRTPVGGIVLVLIGVAALVDSLTGSDIIVSALKAVAPLVLPVLFLVWGIRMLVKE